MIPCVRSTLRTIYALWVTASIAGASSPANKGQELPQCDGTTYMLKSAVPFQLIDRFRPLRLMRTDANTNNGAPHATITVSWSPGVNVSEGLHQTLAVGQSGSMDKGGTSTLIDMALPPRARNGRRRLSVSSSTAAHRHYRRLRRR